MADMTCPKCDTTLVRVKREPFVSAGGCLAAIFFLIGLGTMIVSPTAGLILWAIAAVVSMAGGKDEWLTCPKCKKDVVKL